jgi:cytochrome c oxidase subunit 2
MPLFEPASVQGQLLRSDWLIFFGAAVVIALVVYTAIIFAVLRWRRRDDEEPEQFNKNTPLEITYAVIPLLIVVWLFSVTLHRETPVDTIEARPANRIDVTAFRWSWHFHYAGSNVAVTGTPEAPPTLVLPAGQTTEIDLTSEDVTHSFWVPQFLFKRDAIPGMINRFDVKPTREGKYHGLCAQFCGLDHADMTFDVHVVPQADYARYLASHGAKTP